ncbi:MAG: hypothetical protein LBE57_06205 [Methanosarcinales archaeon]|jgi:predicted outer membrane repeat protein|nr:hypothetical protein [Methanosarcinales archaeon]
MYSELFSFNSDTYHFRTFFKSALLISAALILLFSFAGSVDAISSEAELRTAIAGGGIVTLAGDIELTDEILINNIVTLEGTGILTVTGSYRHFRIETGGDLTLADDVTLTHANPGDNGGGVLVNFGRFTMSGGTISGNTAEYGGGVRVNSSGTFTMSDGTISGNTAGLDGGGIYNLGAGLAIDSGNVINNEAGRNAGGVYTSSGLTMWNGNIDRNRAGTNAGSGGIAGGVLSLHTFTMHNGSVSNNFVENVAAGGARGMGIQTAQFIMHGGKVNDNNFGTRIGNDINGGGGIGLRITLETDPAISTYPVVGVRITGGEIKGNRAVEGGGIFSALPVEIIGNAEVRENTALNGGGGIYASGITFPANDPRDNVSAKVTLSDDAGIYRNTARWGGGIHVTANSTVEISGNAVISYNTASTYGGGGIDVLGSSPEWGDSAGSLIISGNAEISHNTARWGGGINAHNTDVVVRGSASIIGNMADRGTGTDDWHGWGGGIMIDHDLGWLDDGYGSVTVSENAVISGNNAENGGGIGYFLAPESSSSDAITISGNARISDNTASENGGGIKTRAPLIISGDVVISGNKALDGSGGGVSSQGGIFNQIGGTIKDNTAAYFGGGIYVAGAYEFSISDGAVSNNTAETGGGVYAAGAGMFHFSGGVISENTAEGDGGGMYLFRSAFEMTEGVISGNTAEGDGGGAYIFMGTFEMTEGEISGNTAGGDGGGAYIFMSTFEMTEGVISGNTAEGDGGGVFLEGNALYMTDGTISDNTAKNDGGGVFLRGSTFDMINGIISGNVAEGDGGGVFYEHADPYDDATKYLWLTISSTSVFENNRASAAFNYTGDPALPAADSQIRWQGENTFGGTIDSVGTVTGIHLLNNFDVNYDRNPFGLQYNVIYGSIEHTAGSVPTDPDSPYTAGAEVTVLGPGTLERDGYVFAGWQMKIVSPPPPPPPFRTVTGSVYPVVFSDLGFGLDFLSAHSVTVELRESPSVPAPDSLRTIVTADSVTGNFVFEDVPYGDYVLFINRPGYLARGMLVRIEEKNPDPVVLAPSGSQVFELWGGDVNGDRSVDVDDMMLFQGVLGAQWGDSKYSASFDLNADGVIDMDDYGLLISNLGLTSNDYPHGVSGFSISVAEEAEDDRIYQPGDKFIMPDKNVILFAQWQLSESTGGGGGNGTGNATVRDNVSVILPPSDPDQDPGYEVPLPPEGGIIIILLFMIGVAVFCYRRVEESEKEK